LEAVDAVDAVDAADARSVRTNERPGIAPGLDFIRLDECYEAILRLSRTA
jgi:hypothetical protein